MSRIDKLLEYLKTSENDAFLQHALALEYIKIGDDAAAEGLFTAILEREPGYIGSYYHLGKLQERNGDHEAAIATYAKGMEEAKKAGDRHAYSELQMAREDLDE